MSAILRQRMSDQFDPGFIYVIQMEGHPVYKIGRAKDVPRRMSQIGIQLPFAYKVIFAHKVPHVHYMESDLHHDFRALRTNGEWFQLTDLAVAVIKSKLLYSQSEWLTQRIIHRFQEDDLYPDVLRDYGKVFSALGRRNGRRLEAEVNAERDLGAEMLTADVLSAEIIL